MIAAVEINTDGKICRIVRLLDPARPVLEVIATGHRFSESDVAWCRRDARYYSRWSSSWTGRLYLNKLVDGVRHRLLLASIVTCSTSIRDAPLSPAEISKLGYDVEDQEERIRLSSLTRNFGEVGYTSTYWCGQCNDCLPEDAPCDCVYWCDDCGEHLDKLRPCEHYCEGCESGPCYNDCDDEEGL